MSKAILAVEQLNKDAFFDYVAAVYAEQDSFYDDKANDMSPNQLLKALGAIAAKVAGVTVDEFVQAANSKEVVQQVKYHTKYGRQNGIHSSPTFMINGLINNAMSSGWSAEQFNEVIEPLVKSNL
eukprot:TRINITY_DN66967_c3_g1_i2.p3 TRINITY_DN66967_c3_g1~~TRINITY_DN66967_c3_g1_i2.p3  ORF type:complete len:125 (+),score=77.84 TRINITY_DN66967_c3_g1_i2:366-740(+)